MYVSGIIFKSKKLISVLLAAVLCFALFMFIQSFTAKESSDDVKEDAALTSTIQGAVKALMEAGS